MSSPQTAKGQAIGMVRSADVGWWLFAEALASLTLEDERLGILEGRGPVETVAERLGHQGS